MKSFARARVLEVPSLHKVQVQVQALVGLGPMVVLL